MKSQDNVFESRSGIRLDTPVTELFEKISYLKEYIISVNPRFNQLQFLAANGNLAKMTLSDLADLGQMPGESLIYMMESRISEE